MKKSFWSRLILERMGLRYKLWIAFILIVLLPMSFASYIVCVHLPPALSPGETFYIVATVVAIMTMLGWLPIRSIIRMIRDVSEQARLLAAAGELEKPTPDDQSTAGVEADQATGDQEQTSNNQAEGDIGIISSYLNKIMDKMNRDMEEIKNKSEELQATNMSLEEKVTWLSNLFNMSNCLVSTTNINEVLQNIMDMSLKVLNADAGSLMLSNGDPNKLKVKVSRWPGDQGHQASAAIIDERLATQVFHTGEALLVNGVKTDNIQKGSDHETKDVRSAISVPLRTKDKVVGVLNLSKVCSSEDIAFSDNSGSGTGGGSKASEGHVGGFTRANMEFLTTLGNQAAVAIENARLYQHLEDTHIGTLAALIAAVEAKDSYTRGHSEKVSEYAAIIAERMGYVGEDLETIRHAALLHDIGKIGINENVLKKVTSLSHTDWIAIRRHPLIAKKILEPIGRLRAALPLIYHHHESYDGTGYPSGKKGDDIPLGARILCVADAFEAMTSQRVYRDAMDIENAIEQLRQGRGKQFDPAVVDTFLNVVKNELPIIMSGCA